MVKVTGDGSGQMMEKILRHHEAADVAEVGSECELGLKIPRQYFSRSIIFITLILFQRVKQKTKGVFIPKITNFDNFGDIDPTFLKLQW